MANAVKNKQVENIQDLLSKQPLFIFIKYDRTTHQQMENLRKQLKSTDSSFKVIKNTLLEKAINKLSSGNKLLSEFRKKAFPLKENTALLTLGKEWDKALNNFAKFTKNNKTLSFKIGIIDGQIYLSDNLNKIAQLPPKEQLMAKVIGSIKSPMNSLVFNLKFNTQKLVYILQNIKKG